MASVLARPLAFLRARGHAAVTAGVALVLAAHLLPLPGCPASPSPPVILPDELHARPGHLTELFADSPYPVTFLLPGFDSKDIHPHGNRVLFVPPAEPGKYPVYAVAARRSLLPWGPPAVLGPFATAVIVDGPLPPVPPVPPTPPVPPVPPEPPVPPAPIPEPGLRVLIVEDSARRDNLTAGQQEIILGKAVRDYLSTACVLEPDGKTRGFRIWDRDVTGTEHDLKCWADAMKRPRQSVPWLIVSNGKTGYDGRCLPPPPSS